MNEVDALELVQSALWTTMWICVPLVLPAMAVGIIVALFQALTQIQESTLTFVPKMIVVFFLFKSFEREKLPPDEKKSFSLDTSRPNRPVNPKPIICCHEPLAA